MRFVRKKGCFYGQVAARPPVRRQFHQEPRKKGQAQPSLMRSATLRCFIRSPGEKGQQFSRKTKCPKQIIEPRPKVPRGKAKLCHRACQKKAIQTARAPNGYLPVAWPVEKIYLYCHRACRNAAVTSTSSMATIRSQWFRQTKPPGAALKNARLKVQTGRAAGPGKDCITIQLYV